jgi:hypothetical protein
VLRGGNYELRTVAAMSLRTLVWCVISIAAYRQLNPRLADEQFKI